MPAGPASRAADTRVRSQQRVHRRRHDPGRRRLFVGHLNSQVAACDVFLAVIGMNWLEARAENGARALDDPDDFVRIELAAAPERPMNNRDLTA